MVAMKDIEAFAASVAREFSPERIILFGSWATGRTTRDSDVDLLIVMPHAGKSWEMATAIRTRVHPKFPLDLLVRSPRQLQDRLAMDDPFLKEITERGKVLYENDNRREASRRCPRSTGHDAVSRRLTTRRSVPAQREAKPYR